MILSIKNNYWLLFFPLTSTGSLNFEPCRRSHSRRRAQRLRLGGAHHGRAARSEPDERSARPRRAGRREASAARLVTKDTDFISLFLFPHGRNLRVIIFLQVLFINQQLVYKGFFIFVL